MKRAIAGKFLLTIHFSLTIYHSFVPYIEKWLFDGILHCMIPCKTLIFGEILKHQLQNYD